MHQLHTLVSSALTFLLGDSDIALYGPIYVTTACFYDGPTHTADESPLYGQCRNGERTLHWIRNEFTHYVHTFMRYIMSG